MKIPQKIEIEIINNNNRTLEVEIILGLKIYIADGSYLNFSPLKTNSNGKLIIDKMQVEEYLVEKTEFLPNLNGNVDVEIWDCEIVSNFKKSLEFMENISESDIKTDLINRGFDENSANKYSKSAFKKITQDNITFNYFKNSKNCDFSFKNYKLSDVWNEEMEKKYTFQTK